MLVGRRSGVGWWASLADDDDAATTTTTTTTGGARRLRSHGRATNAREGVRRWSGGVVRNLGSERDARSTGRPFTKRPTLASLFFHWTEWNQVLRRVLEGEPRSCFGRC
jgi:hypothetical protein